MGISNPGLGGTMRLEVNDTIATNDDIRIRVWSGQEGVLGKVSEVSIWRGDVYKLIAALEAHLKVRHAYIGGNSSCGCPQCQ